MNSTARGRRRGSPGTKQAVLDVARRQFLANGYPATTMRSIAAEAGVDVALLSYYFGSKSGLFSAALALEVNPPLLLHKAIDGDPATLPERVVQVVISTWDDPELGGPLRLMLSAATQDPEVARLVKEVLQTEMIRQLAERFGGVGATARATAFGSQVAGLLLTRYWLQIEPIASMTVRELVPLVAPGLRAAMAGPRRVAPHASDRNSSAW